MSLPSDGVIQLDYFTPGDASVLCDGDRDPEHRRRFELPADLVPSVEHALAVIESWRADRERGDKFAFAVRRVAGVLVGGCEVWLRNAQFANLSYWVHPPHRRQGYARRAVVLACAWVREATAVQNVEILADPDNLASRRVALACGFEEVGTVNGRILHTLGIERPSAKRP